MNEFKKTYPEKQYVITNNFETYEFYTNGEIDLVAPFNYKEYTDYVEYLNRMNKIIEAYEYKEAFDLYDIFHTTYSDIDNVIKALKNPKRPDIPNEEITKRDYKEMLKKIKNFEKVLEEYIEKEDEE